MDKLSKDLVNKSQEMGVPVDQLQADRLINFILLLEKWNKTYNLTSIVRLEDMLVSHLLDSLSIFPHMKASSVLDVGSGGGLPGIPLACLFPDVSFTLLDANSKKTRFLQQCKIALSLNNVEVVHHRIETFEPNHKFQAIISRAFATIEDMILGSHHLLSDNGHFMAMKGRFPDGELDSLPSGFVLDESFELDVPGLNAERHLLIINRQ